MIIKVLRNNRPGTVLITALLVLSVAILTISFSNSYFRGQISNYQQLDNFYKQKIVQRIDKTDTIRFLEYTTVE